VALATFDLIVLAAAFDRWRMGGLASRRSQGPPFRGEGFLAALVSYRAKVEASTPYKTAERSRRGRAGVEGTTVLMCALIIFTTERRTDVR
jgi:hypothetical protein